MKWTWSWAERYGLCMKRGEIEKEGTKQQAFCCYEVAQTVAIYANYFSFLWNTMGIWKILLTSLHSYFQLLSRVSIVHFSFAVVLMSLVWRMLCHFNWGYADISPNYPSLIYSIKWNVNWDKTSVLAIFTFSICGGKEFPVEIHQHFNHKMFRQALQIPNQIPLCFIVWWGMIFELQCCVCCGQRHYIIIDST